MQIKDSSLLLSLGECGRLACSTSALLLLDRTTKAHYHALEKGKEKRKAQRDLGNELFGGLISLRGTH